MINHKLKILFIDITKTAGTSIIQTFKNNYPDQNWQGKHHSIKNFLGDVTCSTLTDEIIKNYRTFTVVRNPFDRILSLYIWGIDPQIGDYTSEKNFESFVKSVRDNKYSEFNKVRYRTQLDWITDKEKIVRVDNILRFENLQEDFDKLMSVYNLKKMNIEKINTGEEKLKKIGKLKKNYREYYNQEIKEIVENLYKEDIEYFNYQF